MSRVERTKVSQLDDVSKAIIEQLQHDGRKSYAEIGKAVDSPNLRAKFQELSFIPNHSSQEQFRKFIQEDLAKVGKVIKDANIRIEP